MFVGQRMVIRTDSVKYMPFFLSFSLLLNASVWFTFAMLVGDYYVLVSFRNPLLVALLLFSLECHKSAQCRSFVAFQVPNAVGIVLGSLQLIVYLVYKYKPSSSGFIEDFGQSASKDLEQGKDGSCENRKISEGSLPMSA